MSYFVPEGYQTTSEAILALAAAKWPERWSSISAQERSVWHSLNKPGGITIYRLEYGVAQSKSTEVTERYCDFTESANLLRQNLFSKNTKSCFCDERGRLVQLQSSFWGSNLAEEALLEGCFSDRPLYDLTGIYTRLILIEGTVLQSHMNPALKTGASSIERPASRADIRDAFILRVAEWPENKTHPPEEDDQAVLEILLGKRVNRDMLRDIRREIAPAWKSRGRPRKAKSAEN